MATQLIKSIPVELIWADYSRNVRAPWKYKVEPNPENPGFYEDILMNGVLTKIEVSELSESQYRVIRGHRRFKAVEMIRAERPELFQQLTCVVYRGLKEVEELSLLCDHGGTEPLNEFELYLTVKRLLATGLSQEAIGTRVGKTRSWVQDRVYIAQLPECVEEAYARRYSPEGKALKDYVPFTHEDVDELYRCWKADCRAGIGADSAESAFAACWRKLAAREPACRKSRVRELEARIAELEAELETYRKGETCTC